MKKIIKNKAPFNQKIKVLVVPSDRTGVSYFRSTRPHLQLEKLYPNEFHIDIDYDPKLNDDKWLTQYDIIHYHRTLGDYNGMELLIKKLKNLGIVSIMDIDDYWSPGIHHPAYHTIKKEGLDKKILNNIKISENITTTTNIYKKYIEKINKNVFVLPNAIDPTDKQFISNKTKSNRIRIGWLGGSAHIHDLKLLEGVVTKLKSSNLLDKVQFVICGFDTRGKITNYGPNNEVTSRDITPKESIWYEYEKIFTDNYTNISKEYKKHLLRFIELPFKGVENEPYRRVWTKDINTYATNYNLFDISLAPLAENTFNKTKSQLKIIESGFFKKPIIAQNYGPYTIDLKNAYIRGGEIDITKNSFLVDSHKNHKDWFKFIKKFINNPELIDILGINLYNTVSEKYSLNTITEKRKNYYLNLLKNRK